MNRAAILRSLPQLKLTPIPCLVCGKTGSGRYANRATICWRCRKKLATEFALKVDNSQKELKE